MTRTISPSRRPARGAPRSRAAGFTLIELLVVLGILSLALLLGIPAIQNLIVRSRTEGFAREVAVSLQRARLEAIKMNRAGAAFLDPATGELVVYLDADGALADGVRDFAPDPDQPKGTADYVLARLAPPRNVEFRSPTGGEGEDSIFGFTNNGGSRWLIFRPDGSAIAEGAFRIADVRDNFLEVRVAPAGTGRIQLRKWQEDGGGGEGEDEGEGPAEEDKWLSTVDPSDPSYVPWKWN